MVREYQKQGTCLDEKWASFTEKLTFDLCIIAWREEFHIKKDERAWPVNSLVFGRRVPSM